MTPCWIGSSSPPASRSSTVRTDRPLAMAASTVQLLTGSPSIHSTHVPQLDVSQPQWVPVRPRWSRTKCTSSSRGSTSRVTSVPLTVIVTCMSGTFSSCSGRGTPQRAPDQLPCQRALVVRRSPLVGRRVGGGGRGLGGGRQVLVGGGLAPQRVLGRGGAEVVGADRGQPDADVAHRVA